MRARVLDAHCAAIGRYPAEITRSAFLHVVGHVSDHLGHSGSLASPRPADRQPTSFPPVLEAALVYLSIDGMPGNDLWSIA
ncbi:hypothetical protein ACWGH3_27975 [Streptomyces sp. NPDC054884]|uniref:hypothetical protein n=1 Tax=Streptomyces sp. B21-105 TaxID=3039417 RepID=UPI002FEE9D35